MPRRAAPESWSKTSHGINANGTAKFRGPPSHAPNSSADKGRGSSSINPEARELSLRSVEVI